MHTLLIVEDDLDTAEMLRVYFEAQGYQVVPAYTGQEALEQAQLKYPDLVLLDVRLPDIDGFEVGKRLLNDHRTSRLPIIFVTERRDRDYRIAGLKLGDYITKPFDIQELRLRVRNTLRRIGSQNNPVTGLPGYELSINKLEFTLERPDWAVIKIRIDGLDLFNDIYGFVARDDVLRAVALILNSAVDESGTMDDFVGQPSEYDFIVITHPTKINHLREQIQNRLDQAIIYFFPIHDREAGYVIPDGDEHRKTNVPFLTLSTKTASNHTQEITSFPDLQKALAL